MNNRSSSEKTKEPLAVLTLRTVKAGLEDRFEGELHDFISRSLQTEGQLGVSVMRPVQGSGSREYGILRRFSDPASRHLFYNSPLFKEWEVKIASLTEGEPKHQELSGLETWFVLPGQRALIPPPRWKMSLVTLLGVWPTSMFVPWLLQPLANGLPFPWQALFIGAGIVGLLTWAVMPVLVRILKPWVYPS
jgi:antibiotic biosynthesis monooxygenase (ABM) superfamily enzyme